MSSFDSHFMICLSCSTKGLRTWIWLDTCFRVRASPVNSSMQSAMSSLRPRCFSLCRCFRRPMGGYVMSAVNTVSVTRTTKCTPTPRLTAEEGFLEMVGPFLVTIALIVLRLSLTVLPILLTISEASVKAFSIVLNLRFIDGPVRPSIAILQRVSILGLWMVQMLMLMIRYVCMSRIGILARQRAARMLLRVALIVLRLVPINSRAKVHMTVLLSIAGVFLQHT